MTLTVALTVLLAVVGVAAVLAGTEVTVAVAVLLACAGEWSDRARVAP